MATTDRTKLAEPGAETAQAQAMAARYRCDFIDLREAGIDHDLFRSIPVDLMFRYNFVPLHAQNGTLDIALVIKLVDTTIFNALERRASDIHIESRDQEVAIKYRIDGVLHYAMPPISKDWQSTIISRIKVMSELDIAEKRVPQDGRF